MKKLFLLICLSLPFTGAQLFGQSVLIRVNRTQMQNIDCDLTGAAKVYIHSGLCSSNAQDCNTNATTWQHVVGNWGMDDGLGLMTDEGNGIYSICLDFENYYGDTANTTSPFPQGGTAYAMGFVFRNEDATAEGKDDLCMDLFVRDLNTANPVVQQSDGTSFPPVIATACGTNYVDPIRFSHIEAFPNPFNGSTHIRYFNRRSLDRVTVQVYNSLGERVALLYDGPQAAGDQELTWEAATQLGAGIYYFSIDADGQQFSDKLILVN